MSIEDKAYFQGRAEEEIELAQNAGHPDAARSHYLLAAYYLNLVHPDGDPVHSAKAENIGMSL